MLSRILALNPYVVLALVAAYSGSLWYAQNWGYNRGASHERKVHENYLAAQARMNAKESILDTEATVKVVTNYVELDRQINRDPDVLEQRLDRVCSDAGGAGAVVPPSPSVPPGATPRDTRDAPPIEPEPRPRYTRLRRLASEIPQCVETANRLKALQDFIRERWTDE